MKTFRLLLFLMSATTGIASALVFSEEQDKSSCSCEKKKEALKKQKFWEPNKKSGNPKISAT